jgi:uncharacterized membrane protein (DUF106 family)
MSHHDFTYKKDPSILSILLKYFTHRNLLEEAKDDLDEINQKLQDAMDKGLKNLQDKQEKLREDTAKLLDVEMDNKKAKELAINSKK